MIRCPVCRLVINPGSPVVHCEPGFYPPEDPDIFIADEDVDLPVDVHYDCLRGLFQATILPLDKEIA